MGEMGLKKAIFQSLWNWNFGYSQFDLSCLQGIKIKIKLVTFLCELSSGDSFELTNTKSLIDQDFRVPVLLNYWQKEALGFWTHFQKEKSRS